MRSPFMHVENTPLRDGLGDVRFPTPVPKSEGPGAPSSWFKELTGTGATRRRAEYAGEAITQVLDSEGHETLST
jgi:hypothetical protein